MGAKECEVKLYAISKMSKLKAITKRALEIREKGGFKIETIEKKRYNVAYIPTAIKQAAKELKKEAPAKLKRTTRKVAVSKIKKKPFKLKLPRVSDTKLSYETARNAFIWNSMSPDKRGKSTQQEYAQTINSFAEKIEKLVIDKAQVETAKSTYQYFVDGYDKHFRAWLSAMGRTASSFVTGPSKFPVERNRKALDVEHKRSVELLEFINKAENGLVKRLHAALPETKKDEIVDLGIKKDIYKSCARILAIKNGGAWGDIALFRKNLQSRLETLRRNDPKTFNNAIDYLHQFEAEAGQIVFAKNNPIRQKVSAQKVVVEVEKQTGSTIIYDKNGLKVEDNKGDERVRMFFDGKPSRVFIDALKRAAFKWSPSNSAWQRKNTYAAILAAKNFINDYVER